MRNEGCVTSQLVLLQRSVTRSVTNIRRGSVTDPSKTFTAKFTLKAGPFATQKLGPGSADFHETLILNTSPADTGQQAVFWDLATLVLSTSERIAEDLLGVGLKGNPKEHCYVGQLHSLPHIRMVSLSFPVESPRHRSCGAQGRATNKTMGT